MTVVDLRRDDQVHLPELVLEQHEDDSLGGRRALARDRHAGDRDARPVLLLAEHARRERPVGKVRSEQLERMDADRDARQPVVGEHPLPRGLPRELGRADRRVERERELVLLAARAGNRLRARDEAELPEERAPALAEAVARARGHERLELVATELGPLCQVAHVPVRPVPLALGDDKRGVVLADVRDVLDPHPHRAVLVRALRERAVHVGRPHLDALALRVAHERRRRVEAHRLRVQERAEELRRVVVAQPRRLVGEQRRTRRRATSGSRSRRSR